MEHVLGKYIISDKPMSEKQWARERATVIDATPLPPPSLEDDPAKRKWGDPNQILTLKNLLFNSRRLGTGPQVLSYVQELQQHRGIDQVSQVMIIQRSVAARGGSEEQSHTTFFKGTPRMLRGKYIISDPRRR